MIEVALVVLTLLDFGNFVVVTDGTLVVLILFTWGGGSSIILQMPYLPTIILWSLGNHDIRSLGCIGDIDLRRIPHCDRR